MIIEDLEIKEQYFELSNQIVDRINKNSRLEKDKTVIAICGESGSGKSVTSVCLSRALAKQGIASTIIHQDGYYKLTPKENHNRRKTDLNWVGTHEVNLDLIQDHIEAFRSGKELIIAPLVDYKNNTFIDSEIILKDKPVLIVEGVYSLLLKALDVKIFLEKNYINTKAIRKERSREDYDKFVEKVLEIEHYIISKLKTKADIIIDENYNITKGVQ